jgi:hypothetical protein
MLYLQDTSQERKVLVPWKNSEVLIPTMEKIELIPLSVSSQCTSGNVIQLFFICNGIHSMIVSHQFVTSYEFMNIVKIITNDPHVERYAIFSYQKQKRILIEEAGKCERKKPR